MLSFPVLFTVFLDFMGFGLVFPILAPLLLETSEGVLPEEASLATRGFLIGLLISSYFLAQFFSAPILGALSDRQGRKKILLVTIALALLGFLIGGCGVCFKSIYLLFLSRLVAGFAAGNYAVAQSVITDFSPEESKTKNFGMINMACGSGFIIGPFIGGKLSDPQFASWCNFATPFWFAALLCLINILWMSIQFRETLQTSLVTPLNIFKGVQNLQKAFKSNQLKMLFASMFVFSFGWGFFCEFIPLFLIQKYHYTPSEIGNFYVYMGSLVAICQGFLIRPFLKRHSPKRLLIAGFFAMGSIMPIALLFNSSLMWLGVLPLILFFEAFIYPNASTIVSNNSSKENQGELLGIHQSVQSAAIAFSPLFSGALVALYPHLPITIGSIATLSAGLLFLLGSRKTVLA
jgi:DHA1 family tetracycline resistance protein-like MFS transporter